MHCALPGDYHSLGLTRIQFHPPKVTPRIHSDEVTVMTNNDEVTVMTYVIIVKGDVIVRACDRYNIETVTLKKHVTKY